MIDPLGRPLKAHAIADRMLTLAHQKGLWETIDFIVGVWLKKNPKEADEHKKFVQDQKNIKINKYGSTQRKNGELGGLRHIGEVPMEIYTAIDMLCYRQLKAYGEKKFYREFFKRYPIFKTAEKI